MSRSFVFDGDYMRKDYPVPPEKILVDSARGLLGIVSPSRFFQCIFRGDPDVAKWRIEFDKYNIWRRRMPKDSWKDFYRRVRKGRVKK